MSDAGKTLAYIGVALLLAFAAYFARPKTQQVDPADQAGKLLFADFDTTKVRGLKIVRFDEDLGEIEDFEVSRNATTGLWTIPSHSNYPADAEDRIKDAATIFVGVEILDVAKKDDVSSSDHQYYGVVEPDKDKLRLGDEGVGLLVQFEGEKGNDHSLIVGKLAKGAEGLRFVRKPNQDPIYVAKIDPEKLSTKFEEWIEEDLLKLNTWDVEDLGIKDYSLVQTVQGTILEPRFEIGVTYNSDDSKWEVKDFQTFSAQAKKMEPTQLLDSEELNKEKLDEVKNNLDDLKIVDVQRKPKGLGVDLKLGQEFMDNREARDSLRSRGFFPNPIGNNQYDLLAANGEVHASTKDGVEYILRFGNVAGTEEESEEAKLNRYMLVTARVDYDKLPRPEIEDLPPLPAGGDAAPAKPAEPTPSPADAEGDTSADGPPNAGTEPSTFTMPQEAEKPAPPEKPAQPAEKPAEPKPVEKPAAKPLEKPAEKPAEPKPEAKPAEKPAEPKPEAKPAEKPAEPKPEAKPAEKPAEPKPEAKPAEKPAEPKPEAKPAEKPAEPKPEAKPAEKPAAVESAPADEGAMAKPDAAAEAAQVSTTEIEAERARITKENQRKTEEWEEKKKEADKKVRELNARFADWYYVVSEDVYKKLRLSRSDLLKETEEAKEEGFGVDALRKLQDDGIEGGESEASE